MTIDELREEMLKADKRQREAFGRLEEAEKEHCSAMADLRTSELNLACALAEERGVVVDATSMLMNYRRRVASGIRVRDGGGNEVHPDYIRAADGGSPELYMQDGHAAVKLREPWEVVR